MNQDQKIKLPDFSDLHLIVLGDVMIDRYVTGRINRISPEAPVPVLELENTENRPGGAANVAINLHALGAKVTLVSIVGKDAESEVMIQLLSNMPNLEHRLIKTGNRKTTIKTRVMAGYQHILRIDSEDTHDISHSCQGELMEVIQDICGTSKVHGLILQDYNKGLFTTELIHSTISYCNQKGIPTFVDPKEKNFFEFRHCTIFKPNKKEVLRAIRESESGMDEVDALLRQKLEHDITVITLGSEGIYIHDTLKGQTFPTIQRDIADVCGAGDTVLSLISLCYLKGMDSAHMAIVANIAGGQVCEKPGVASIERETLNDELQALSGNITKI